MAAPKSGKTAKIELDRDQIAFMVSIGCTQKEMAAFFKCSVDTLSRNYAEQLEQGAEMGKASAKRTIWRHFENGQAIATKYVIHNILKQKIEDNSDKDLTKATNEVFEKLNTISTDMILKLVKNDETA